MGREPRKPTKGRRELQVTISGGDAFERARLASEFTALLESLYIPVDVGRGWGEADNDERHHDHLNHIAHTCVVRVRPEEP